MRSKRASALLLGLLIAGVSCTTSQNTSTSDLKGLFAIDAGECTDAGVTAGSYFRMIQPGGKAGAGPFVTNGDSGCADKTFTSLSPGEDGGLIAGDYQPNPDPAFDDAGNARAQRITEPQKWFAVAFALSTNPVDPQTELKIDPPTFKANDRKLTGGTGALGAAWNGQFFNQGAPKPDGTSPGGTVAPTGTYDSKTGRYSLDWSSQIVGGPFNNFIGTWHLEGKFQPSKES